MIQYWNVFPNFVKLSSSVNAFKANLCVHKSQQLKSEHYVSSVGHFWEVSERVLQRIESPSAGRSIVVGVTGFKLAISVCSLIC